MAFRASLAVMVLVVLGAILLPSLIEVGGGTRDVGLAGSVPEGLADSIRRQAEAVGVRVRIRTFDSLAAGQEAVRDRNVDVLVADGRRLEWQRRADEQLQAVVSGAIQLVAVRERAAAAGLTMDDLLALVAPVPVDNVELGSVAGRSPDDETAALVMTVLLFVAITTYGNLVLTGVVEEKTSRVVEVLLARIPARSLLAGKVAGIGLLGLGQFLVTAVAALIAVATVDTVDIPAARPAVILWVVAWFALGYALYAMVYGALGSLVSRSEDSGSVSGTVTAVLIVAYFAAFTSVGRPESAAARVVSLFPLTAPLSMPNRVAMGGAAWWEPVLAVALTLAAIAALVQLGGRLYSSAILRSGPTLRLRDLWRRPERPDSSARGVAGPRGHQPG